VEEVVAELRRPTVMVSHGGVARALLVILGHLDIRAAVRMGIRQGSVLVLDAEGWRWT
jgi:broad specificity phosphatase PhoE